MKIQLEAAAGNIIRSYAPGRVTVSFPLRGQQLNIYYSSIEINEGNPPFHYVVPGNARITIR